MHVLCLRSTYACYCAIPGDICKISFNVHPRLAISAGMVLGSFEMLYSAVRSASGINL